MSGSPPQISCRVGKNPHRSTHSSGNYPDEWGTVYPGYDVAMPYGLHRYQQAETLHFITFSCFHRLPYLAAPAAKNLVQAVLEQTRARHQARIYAYVLMPEHVHLLMNEPPRILVAQLLKVLKQNTSRHLKGERDQFWQTRDYDANISGEDERTGVIRYIHRNPVKRELVTKPEDYPWTVFATTPPATLAQ